jgi:hypothetical protein
MKYSAGRPENTVFRLGFIAGAAGQLAIFFILQYFILNAKWLGPAAAGGLQITSS